MTKSRRAAVAAGLSLLGVAFLFGALAADPVGVARAFQLFRLSNAGAVRQFFRAPDGTRLRVLTLGKLSAQVPVVLVHGLGASADYWTWTALALHDRGRTVLLLDMPGSGGSEPPASASGYALPNRVAALSSLVSALALEKVDLVGHSLGGWTAGLYAIAEPWHVRRLVLVDAGGFTKPEGAAAELLRGSLTPQTRSQGEALTGLLFRRPPFPRTGFVIDAISRMYRLPAVVETVARFDEKDGLLGKEERLPGGTVLIWGEHDTLLPLADARRAAAKIPDARLLVITGVGHDGPLEAPRVFDDALSRALSP